MIIILDTAEGRVKEISQITDALISTEQLEYDIKNLIAVTIMGQSMKIYKTKSAKELYIDSVSEMAKHLLDMAEEV